MTGASTPRSRSRDSGIGTPSTDSSVEHPGQGISSKSGVATQKLFILSAPEQGTVPQIALALASFLEDKSSESWLRGDALLDDLAYTLGSRRSIFQWRTAIVASSAKELVTKLSTEAQKPIRASKAPKPVWIFNGQGAQWFAMGRELLAHTIFMRSIIKADEYLASLGARWSVLHELTASEESSRIDMATFSQPLCTILQIALVDLLKHWGLQPAAVIGHSSGEIGAAYALGALTAQDCWKIAYHRGHLSQLIKKLAPENNGAMMSVGLSEQDVEAYLKKLDRSDVAVIACINSPSNVTVSGDSQALSRLEAILKAAEVFARRLKVETAYHSPHMMVIANDYLASIHDITPLNPDQDIVMYSSVTGSQIAPADLEASYWVKNMTSPVQFVKALDNVFPSNSHRGRRRGRRNQAIDTVVELGPHSALQGPIKQILTANGKLEGTTYLSALRRGQDAMTTSLEVAGRLWVKGSKVHLMQLNSTAAEPTPSKVLVDLPSYQWNHANRYWHESSQTKTHRFPRAARLDLLGAPVQDFNPLEPQWKNSLRIAELPWLVDHKIQNGVIFPAAGMVCAVLEAARQIADPDKVVDSFELREITIIKALVIPEPDDGVEVFLHLKPRKVGLKAGEALWFDFSFYSLGLDGNHAEHSSGLLKIEYKTEASDIEGGAEMTAEYTACRQKYKEASQECVTVMSPDSLYENLSAKGMHYGMLFIFLATPVL